MQIIAAIKIVVHVTGQQQNKMVVDIQNNI